MRNRHTANSDEGFTLIELVIVTAVLPIVVGALAVGMLSIFSLNSSVTNRLTDSGDAQQVSLYMQNDIQSAIKITTSDSPATSPAPCVPAGSSQQQILAMQLGNGTEVTYGAAQSGTDKGDNLWRNTCPSGSTTPNDSKVIAHDLPTSVTITDPTDPNYKPPVTITCTSSSTACATQPPPNASLFVYQGDWVSTLGITGVTFKVTTPESSYTYQITSVPVATANSTQLAQVATPSTGCGFAVATSGTYASTLCFVDFTPWNTQTAATGVTCPNTAPAGSLPMSANIANTPFTLDFCVSTSATNCNPLSCSGPTSQGAACGVAARSGYNDIAAVALPTYACPGSGNGSEAYLGNNGFYTGTTGNPALYTVAQGSTATIVLTGIQLLNSNGNVATGWQLVTGDAESTDGNVESIAWQSNQKLTLLANSASSPIGNACGSTGQYAPPNYNNTATGLSGVGTTSVSCTNASGTGANHTGTPMLQATTPNSLTVTLKGSGLQGMFMGVILP